MGPASKTSRNISSRGIGKVDAVVRLEHKKMMKEEMTGRNMRAREENKQKFIVCKIILGKHFFSSSLFI